MGWTTRLDMKDTFEEFKSSLAGWKIDDAKYYINYETIRDYSEIRNDVNEGEWGELSISEKKDVYIV